MKLLKTLDKKELLTRILVGILAIGILVGAYFYATDGRRGNEITINSGYEFETARVLEVTEEQFEGSEEYENEHASGYQILELELLTGRYAGDQVTVRNVFSVLAKYSIYAEPGMEITVAVKTVGDNDYQVAIYNYSRSKTIWLFVALFAVLLLFIGGKQGIAAIFGLALTVFGILFVLLPLIVQRGWPPVPTTLLIVSFTMFVSYIFIGGIHTKAMTAALGAFGGVLLAGLFAWIAGEALHISGLNDDRVTDLYRVAGDYGIRLRDLFLCGILISAEGAIMDISMSVASAVEEVHRVDPTRKTWQLFRSGMHIGRDAMGTMANTLILAFAGTGLTTMIFTYAYNVTYNRLMNEDFIAAELIRALAGSLGMILTVPLVAIVAAAIFANQKEKRTGVREK